MAAARWTTLLASLASLASLAACCHSTSGNGSSGGGGSTGGAGASSSSAGATGGSSGGTGGSSTGGGAPDAGLCAPACDAGVCIGGRCCPTDLSCGDVCCAAAQVCLFEGCVLPGATCTSDGNCPAGQYCETALGGDGGSAPPTDAGCVEAAPASGRCLPLPNACDGGVDGGCESTCQYVPPLQLPLHPAVKWTWGPNAREYPDSIDVWSTPTVGRLYDANCDGKIDDLDPPDVVFVSGNVAGSYCGGAVANSCQTGVLRMLDGRNGQEIWSRASVRGDAGFLGFSIALGDVDGDGRMDIVAATGDGYVVLINGDGQLERTSDKPIGATGWGGGLALADLEGTGHPDIIFGSTVFSTDDGGITRVFVGGNGACATKNDAGTCLTWKMGSAGGNMEALSVVANVDGTGPAVVAGNTAYRPDGGVVWFRPDLPDGFNAVADLNGDGVPEVVLVANAQLWVLDGATGKTELGPFKLPSSGAGGPPTVATFDGTGRRQIGVAQSDYYSVVAPDYDAGVLRLLWKMPNHDLSSAVTGSTVFDFEGQGRPSVIYGDECFLWVFDGPTGAVRFETPHSSFTGTEASMVADVDGDGRAEILMVSNGAGGGVGWGGGGCNAWPAFDADAGVPTWVNDDGGGYRGLTAFGDSANSWVGTRTLWNEHGYHVSNVCDDQDDACGPPDVYGSIPRVEQDNWTVPWLNDFRQNVQEKGLFNAPDATLELQIICATPASFAVQVRNVGAASLPAGVRVAVFSEQSDGGAAQVAQGATTRALLPGQFESLTLTATDPTLQADGTFYAAIENNPPIFHACRTDDETTAPVAGNCSFH
ncbi:MAG TPA: VCBS repeat-containing protein [Myxococcales bacterium]|nr:VCBS repeat-containing protein [Myxococcales bacterium]